MNYTMVVVLWSAMALLVVLTAIYRKLVAKQEDNILHLHDGEGGVVSQQASVAHKLEIIDKFGKTATVIVVAGGLVIASFYLYHAWLQSALPQ